MSPAPFFTVETVEKVAWQVGVDFGVSEGNEVETLVAIQVPGLHMVGSGLTNEVCALHLDQSNERGDERRRPGGLFGLRGAGAMRPVSKEVILLAVAGFSSKAGLSRERGAEGKESCDYK